MTFRRTIYLALLLMVGPRGMADKIVTLPTLTTVRQVTELSPEEAARGYPVQLHGVLTFHDWAVSFLQDPTGAIYFYSRDSNAHVGEEVALEGFSAKGRTLPIVRGRDGGPISIRSLGPGKWPQPCSALASSLNDPFYDGRLVSVKGKVTRVARSHDGFLLILESDGTRLQVAIPLTQQNCILPEYLLGMQVTVCGVVSYKPAQASEEDSVGRVVLCVASLEKIELSPEVLERLFSRQRATINDLYHFTTWETPWLRISGQVRFARPGQGFFLLMGDKDNVWVQTSAPGNLENGDFVDVVGRFDNFDSRPILKDAFFRRERSGPLTGWRKQAAGEVKREMNASHGNALVVEGRLVEQQKILNEDTLVMNEAGVIFIARLFNSRGDQMPLIQTGSRIQLRGVCVTKRMPLTENLSNAFAFQVWLSSPADVTLIEKPPWWTVRRVFILCGIILLLGVLASVWAMLLQWQVARQSATIARQREQNAVEEERIRIARELHDTLGQELVGIGLHLDLASRRMSQVPQQAEEALKSAQKMLHHSQAEIKRSVAGLRAGELDQYELPTALENLARTMLTATDAPRFKLHVEGMPQPLEAILEHYLLRIGQEAVSNAIRHARAQTLQVRIAYGLEEIRLEVQDDGCGFDSTNALSMTSGHFGLLGLRERVNKLRGHLRIESRPGNGTTIFTSVPIIRNT